MLMTKSDIFAVKTKKEEEEYFKYYLLCGE